MNFIAAPTLADHIINVYVQAIFQWLHTYETISVQIDGQANVMIGMLSFMVIKFMKLEPYRARTYRLLPGRRESWQNDTEYHNSGN